MTFDPISGSQLTPSVLQDLLALRYPTPGFLSRSLSEFAELLEIPDTVTLVCRSHEEIIGFCIVGRGYDMIGVVHEWGGASPDIVLAGLRHIAEITEWKSVCLLAPPMLSPDWKASFLEVADSGEQYPMALAKFLRADLVGFLDETYIWGLDSI